MALAERNSLRGHEALGVFCFFPHFPHWIVNPYSCICLLHSDNSSSSRHHILPNPDPLAYDSCQTVEAEKISWNDSFHHYHDRLHNLQGPGQSENVGPRCSKTAKNFETATATCKTKRRALLSVGPGALWDCPGHVPTKLALKVTSEQAVSEA